MTNSSAFIIEDKDNPNIQNFKIWEYNLNLFYEGKLTKERLDILWSNLYE